MPAASPAAPLRILVADDRADHRALMFEALRGPRYQIVIAHDGFELLELLFGMPPQHFAAVVCDVYMPGLRGTEVLARGASRSRFILVSASGDAGIEHAAAEFGAAAIVRKPFDPVDLVELVDSIVDRGSLHAPRRRSDPSA